MKYFKMVLSLPVLFIYALFLLSCSGNNQQEKNPNVQKITHVQDFEINGSGDHDTWGKAEWIDLTQRDSAGYQYRTRVKSLYSGTGIYFLFDCEDSVITSTLQGDFLDLYNEDVVEVFFWTDENYHFYFEYELSPANYELPIMVPNVSGTFFGWRPWHYEGDRKTRHATFIDQEAGKIRGWKAEFFIPYLLLKPLSNVPPVKGTRWRVNMYRIDYDLKPSHWTWEPVRTNFHDYEKFGVFQFN